ncbi:hypothetical protein PGT21_036564 [Puccinia graminis f. sp. tritici]|uniref:Uncharacterized protein n=2 Tax=Puccinia graminis f. sp. tritici TaxID=56615 RepID=A0A5B0NGT8_PUCGR|nr:hypothetical protein PGT21_036564 [Puccinia graminis f. sp. tritici]
MHRWNIHLKFNLSDVRNTSTNVSLATQLLATNGAVSKDNELIYGKFAVVIKDQKMYIGKILALFESVSGKHRWVTQASSRDKLSYISVQLYLYQPHHPMATGFHNGSPDARIFAHLPHVHIHHLFPVTPGLNITEIQNCASIPSKLHPLLIAMSDTGFLGFWESELRRLKSKEKQLFDHFCDLDDSLNFTCVLLAMNQTSNNQVFMLLQPKNTAYDPNQDAEKHLLIYVGTPKGLYNGLMPPKNKIKFDECPRIGVQVVKQSLQWLSIDAIIDPDYFQATFSPFGDHLPVIERQERYPNSINGLDIARSDNCDFDIGGSKLSFLAKPMKKLSVILVQPNSSLDCRYTLFPVKQSQKKSSILLRPY